MHQQIRSRCVLLVALSSLTAGFGVAHGQMAQPIAVALGDAATIRPVLARPILGVQMDQTLVLGDAVRYGTPATSRPAARMQQPTAPVYDSLVMADIDNNGFDEFACGDLCGGLMFPASRWFFGPTFAQQAFADDIGLNELNTTRNPDLSGFRLLASVLSCDNQPAEPLTVIFTLYETPDLDGYDTDGDGTVDSPYPRTDTDGDGLLDQFTGGAVVTFADIDTDGDGIPDVIDPRPNFLIDALNLTDLDGDGTPGDPGAPDFGGFPRTDFDSDGRPDGAVEVFFTQGLGPDTDGDGTPDGPIFGSFVASTLASPFFWGTRDADNSGCADSIGIVDSTSGGVVWGQGQNACPVGSINEGTGWSDGASDGGEVNNFWDPTIDRDDFTAVVSCPDPLTPAVYIEGEGNLTSCRTTPPCADTNGDCFLTPADFNAWIIAFNSQSAVCDQNGDGLCTPADFNAWIVNFNSGAPCP